MASLLPNAGRDLPSPAATTSWWPRWAASRCPRSPSAWTCCGSRYGQRFAEFLLRDFVRSKIELPSTVELLVLRSNEMDDDFETQPGAAPSLIARTLQQVQAAVSKLGTLGFQEAVIVTDHGFYLHTARRGRRCLPTATGQLADAARAYVAGRRLGRRVKPGDIGSAPGHPGRFRPGGGAAGHGPYQAGMTYFHGGALAAGGSCAGAGRTAAHAGGCGSGPTEVTLRYKRGAKRVTTQRPVFEVSVDLGSLFTEKRRSRSWSRHTTNKGKIVGEALHSPPVNPATGTLSLRPARQAEVTLSWRKSTKANSW